MPQIFDGISILPTLKGAYTSFQMADYLAAMISSDGAIRTSYNEMLFWKDCHLAALTLCLMAGKLHPQYQPKVKSLIQWLADNQTPEGMWYDSYIKTGGVYTPPLPPQRCTDRSQTLPIILLAMFSSMFGEEEFVCSVADKMLFGLDVFIQDNYNNDTQLYDSGYSTVGPEPTSLSWTPNGIYTAMGQAWVYMALQSAYALTGTMKYKQLAQQLAGVVGDKFWSETLGCYKPTLDTEVYDIRTIGFCLWVFGSNLKNAGKSVTKALTWKGPDGLVRVPPSTSPFSQNGAWLALALKTTGAYEKDRIELLDKIPPTLLTTYPNSLYGNGGVADLPGHPDLPVEVTACSLLAFSEEPSSVLWWS